MATKRSKIVLFFNYFYFCSISSIPLMDADIFQRYDWSQIQATSVTAYLKDYSTLLHCWKKLMLTLQNKASQWFKIFNHFWCKNSNFLLEWILVFWTYFLKSSFHECLLKGWHWKKAERRASSNSWMQFQGLKCSRVGLLDVFWPP